jgi:hypothetical protein
MALRIRRTGWAFFVLLCATGIVSAQQAEAQLAQTGIIVGTVLDVAGGTVPNANVILQGPGERRTVVTADDGFFTFDGVKPGKPVHIQISASEFENWTSGEIVVDPGQTFIVTKIALAVHPVVTSVTAVTSEALAAEQVKAQEQQRVMGVIPNFYVTYDRNPEPLTSKLKFQLAVKSVTDPVTITGFAANAAIYQAAGYPSFGQGWDAYGQRLGATFAGGYSKILIGDALLPSLLHQDPRYFYQGVGTTKSRLLHAMSCAFVTRGDDGRREINYSKLIGDLASGAIANAYYPSQDRGAGLVVRSSLIGMGGRMALGIVQEFVLHKFTSQHPTQP